MRKNTEFRQIDAAFPMAYPSNVLAETCRLDVLRTQTLRTQVLLMRPLIIEPMKPEKKPELAWKCLDCYKTYKGPDGEQKALNCCGSIVQGVWINYNKWGKHKWYGR